MKLIVAFVAILIMASAQAQDRYPPTMTVNESFAEKIECTKDSREPDAWYVGPYKGYDNNLSGLDMARDLYCADLYKRKHFPNGFVTIYGSSRLPEYFVHTKSEWSNMHTTVETETREYNQTYGFVRTFAKNWTAKYKQHYPIMTGAGPGIMEAGSRGASEAGLSIGYTTYYDKANPGSPHAYTDNPGFYRHAVIGEKKKITSAGFVFSSVAARETAMILHSAAIVIAPGGSGTEWEIFQILEMLKSRQLKPVPVYFIGAPYHWRSLKRRVADMEKRGVIKKGELPISFASCPNDLMNKLSFDLRLEPAAPAPAKEACRKST